MSQSQIEILQRALQREREARKQAEKILEEKSRELYATTEQLKKANTKLKKTVAQKTIELEGFFENLVDAYVLMGIDGNVIKMNESASKLFGYNLDKESLNVSSIVYKEDYKYAMNSFNKLLKEGSFTNYIARVWTKNKEVKLVHINSSLIYDESKTPIAAQGIVRDITEETAIKELIEEQKHQLNIIVEHSPIGITLSKKDEKGLLLANQSLCKMLGYTAKEFERMQVQDITHPEDERISLENREKLFAGEIDSFNLEKRYIKKNGEILWAKTKVTAVRGLNKDIKFIVATIEDINKERQAKERLIESENRLSTLILNLDNGVLLEDENRKIVLTNKKFCDLFSIPIEPELLKGEDFFTSVEQSKYLFENPEEFISNIKTLVKNKKPKLSEDLFMKDGKIIERDFIPIFENNQYKGHLWSYRDMTLRRNYRKSLETQKQKYSNIIANMHLGLIELNTNDEVLMVNQSFLEMSGYDETELIGKIGRDILPIKEDKKRLDEKSEERKAGKATSFEVRVKNKKGELKHWLASAAPNYDINGDNIGSIGVILDITNIKSLELQKENLLKQLERSNNELQEYAHIVSHDLKSPLRSIYALVSWLKEDNQGKLDQVSLRNFALIESTLEKMEQLISDILTYSSATTEQLETAPVDLNDLISDLQKILFFPDHISLKLLKKLPVVQGERAKFQQLFQNLISNAVKFIDKEKGLIEIDVLEQKTTYQFSIKDNGMGIDKKYHDKIFKIFHSLNKSKDSTGIGLSIVKKIVDLYKGEIWLESIPEEGTTFYFTISK